MRADRVEAIRHSLDVGGPAFTLLGVALSVWGTYKQTSEYHSFSAFGFTKTTFRSFWLVLTRRGEKAERQARIAIGLGALNRQNKPVSLLGIYIVFVGFAVQGLGTFLWLADAILGLVKPPK